MALGHIHKPQQIVAAPARTEYGGSPLQLDFGEIGETKTFAVVEATAGLPVRVTRVPYEGVRQLGSFEGTWAELEGRIDDLSRFGYLRVRLTLDEPDPEVNRRVRSLLPNIVSVEVQQREEDAGSVPPRPPPTAPPRDHFAAFYRREHQRDPSSESLTLFDELYIQASES